jgi:hypothetical protein
VRANRFDVKHSEVVAIATSATSAIPLIGLYFRSVEYRHMDPKGCQCHA